ncbi:hypothetical protein HN873_060908, partial [Arachis hypogaea]
RRKLLFPPSTKPSSSQLLTLPDRTLAAALPRRFSPPRRGPFFLFPPSSSSSTHSSRRSSTHCLSTHEELSSSSMHSSRRVRVVPVFAVWARRVVLPAVFVCV